MTENLLCYLLTVVETQVQLWSIHPKTWKVGVINIKGLGPPSNVKDQDDFGK